ncbi:hypothetical protein KP79_PYT02875 [Mizuhopecten yessoensis]|uniref:Uncharacterized protein n=2 Tax=Mizuhopecten yessoensis TaxID=6573 RepID=A0A210PJV9_MIZYE|nr:hypothetical protein KP79_PYT02875 [Mizuhopecten yessoensis]
MSRSDVLINPRYLVVLRNGRIVWYRRIRTRILCEVNQTASTQECNLRMGSKQFPETELVFKEGTCNMGSKLENVNWEISSLNNTMDISTVPLPTKLAFRTGKMSMAQCSLSIEVKNTNQRTSVASELQGEDPDDPTDAASRASIELLVLVCSLIGLYISV